MRKLFWIGILVILAMIGSVKAQAAPNNSTATWNEDEAKGGETPKECGGSFSDPESECIFQCSKGDRIQVAGYAAGPGLVRVLVTADCGGVRLQCRAEDPLGGVISCQQVSEDIVSENDKPGLCTVQVYGAVYRSYGCHSLSPED